MTQQQSILGPVRKQSTAYTQLYNPWWLTSTWTLTNVTSDKLEVFEMWLYRIMLRISWKEHKTNGEMLHKMKTNVGDIGAI